MTKQEFLLNLLLDSLPIKCRYYEGDDQECKKNRTHITCNCDGNIQECDLENYEETE